MTASLNHSDILLRKNSFLDGQAVLSTIRQSFSLLPTQKESRKEQKNSNIRGQADLFAWTLTHRIDAFCNLQPTFENEEDLMFFANEKPEKTITIAKAKINAEWKSWLEVHAEMKIDDYRLDNILMRAIYHLVIKRDSGHCARCGAAEDLTIHHIIPKRRNILDKAPPFGRSVPTNLITLCRKCHGIYDPFIL